MRIIRKLEPGEMPRRAKGEQGVAVPPQAKTPRKINRLVKKAMKALVKESREKEKQTKQEAAQSQAAASV